MTAASSTALNKLLENKAVLHIPSIPNFNFNVKSFQLPGMSLGTAYHPTPLRDRKIPGTKLEYDDITITFFVDEELKSWTLIHNWMRGLASPLTLQEYVDKPLHLETGFLNILTNQNNPSHRITIHEMFPTSLSGVAFTFESADAIVLTADVSFSILRVDIKKF